MPCAAKNLTVGERGLGGLSTLGPRSTGLAESPVGTIADRWIASTKDGASWTEPKPLGSGEGASPVSAGHSSVAAAHGILATMFLASDRASCSAFLGSTAPSPCVVFQTSKDSGAAWSRHRVPTPASFTPAALSVLLGADPIKDGHFTAVLLNQDGSDLWVYRTPDSGATWSEPTKLTEDPTKTHFAPWVATSPSGEVGVMWRTYEPDPARPRASAPALPYSVWAVFSRDGGATFSKPLKVSKADSPAPRDDPDDGFSVIGDHGPSGMAMDAHGGAYMVWADWTSGERSIHFTVSGPNTCGDGIKAGDEECDDPRDQYSCDPDTCRSRTYYTFCADDSDCSGDSTCHEGNCVMSCVSGSDCRDWFGVQGACFAARCLRTCATTSCPPTMMCVPGTSPDAASLCS